MLRDQHLRVVGGHGAQHRQAERPGDLLGDVGDPGPQTGIGGGNVRHGDRQQRHEGTADAQAVVSGMVGVLADLRADLLDMGEAEPELSVGLLEQHARLLSFIRVCAFGQDAGEALGYDSWPQA